jgi:endonuclease VIII
VPEGDSIFKAARTLHRALAGKRVVHFESVFPALSRVHDDTSLIGRTLESVSSAGKHLLMHFSGGLILRTHMRMNGSWHIYRPGERWQRPRRDMRVVIATADFVAVAFTVPVAEFIAADRLERHDELRQLGPDLLADDFDASAATARMRARSTESVADVLLNQRVMAGVGNVYKSEVLFACGVNPFLPIDRLDDETMYRLVTTARRLLVLNVSTALPPMTTYGGLRRTTGRGNPSDRLWVYGRGGLPCRRCGTPISVKKHGHDARITYWCATCQPETR